VFQDILFATLTGLGLGSLYALLGAGIVVGHLGSGVVNVAQGAVAMYATVQYIQLRSLGEMKLPWFDVLPWDLNLPVTIELTGSKMSWRLALPIALLTSVLIGAMLHYLVFRPLRDAAPLIKVVASVGVLLYLQGTALVNFGPSPRPISLLVPDGATDVPLLDKPIATAVLWLAAFALVVGAAVSLLYRRTVFGRATRAAAENEKGAVLVGFSPDRLALANWVLAALLGGLCGIVAGPLMGSISLNGFTLLIVPALGAALVGGLTSVMGAVLGGLGLGMLQSFVSGWLVLQGWTPEWTRNGLRDAVPLILIGVILAARGKSLPVRGAVTTKPLPRAAFPVRLKVWVPAGAAVAIALGFQVTGVWGYSLTTTLIAAILGLSYVVITGWVGQISLAQLSLAGVAAFAMTRFMSDGRPVRLGAFPVDGPGWPWPVAMVLGIVAAVVVGLVVGLPALRVRGMQLAVVTIAATLALESFYFTNAELTGLRGGSNTDVAPPTVFGLDVGPVGPQGLSDDPGFTIFVTVFLVLAVLVVANLRRSTTGRQFLAVRANERAAAATGVNVGRTKLLGFGVASALAGVSGCLTAFQQQSISSANWVFFLGMSALAFVVVGGITSINGALVGGLLVPAGLGATALSHRFEGIEDYLSAVSGLALIVIVVLQPAGVAPWVQGLVHQGIGRLRDLAGGPGRPASGEPEAERIRPVGTPG
jgi:branched-chain amino acid transport system permease protein